MGRFERIEKIDGYEVTLIASYNDLHIYQGTDNKSKVWNVIYDRVIFSYEIKYDEITVVEEYNKL